MRKLLASFLAFLLAVSPVGAQSTTNYRLDAGVSTNPSRPSMTVLGGGGNPYRWVGLTQNMLSSLGPSLRGASQQFVITAAGGTNTSATSNWPYLNEPVNAYAGMSFTVGCGNFHYPTASTGQCSGGAHGLTGTITASTAPIGAATFTASSAGTTTLTVSGVTGTIVAGANPSGAGFPTFVQILSQVDGTPGGAGHYLTSVPTTTSGTATTNYLGPVLTLSALAGGATIGPNDTIFAYSPETTGVVNTAYIVTCNYGGCPAGGTGVSMDTTPADQPSAFVSGLPAPDQTFRVTLANASDVVILQQTIDNQAGVLNYAFNGNYVQAIDVNVLSGSGCQVTGSTVRSLTPTNETIINQQKTITGSGMQTISFNTSSPATETNASPAGNVAVAFSFTGCVGSILVQNPAMGPAVHTNPSILQDAVVADIQAMKVGGIRWNGASGDNGGTFGCSTIDLLQPDKGRHTCIPTPGKFTSGANASLNGDGGFGYDEELNVCKAVGVSECDFNIPPTANDADLQCLAEYLNNAAGVGSGCNGVSGGTIRANRGQIAPWTSVFTTIVIEFDNEAWNNEFMGYNWQYTAGNTVNPNQTNYFAVAAHAATVMQADSWNSTVESFAANVQEGTTPTYTTTILNGNNIGLASIAAYQAAGQNGGLTSASVGTFYDDIVREMQGNAVSASSIQYPYGHSGTKLLTYEGGSNFQGTASGVTIPTPMDWGENVGYGQVEPFGMALLQATFSGTHTHWAEFQFSSHDRPFTNYGSATVSNGALGWGSYQGTSGQYIFPNPTVYGYALVNQCAALGQTNLPVTTNQITVNESASNNVPALTGVQMMPAIVYRGTGANANVRCLYVNDFDRTGAHPFTVSGAEAPAAGVTVTKTLYASGNTYNQSNLIQTGTAVVGPNVVSTVTSFTGDTISPGQSATYVWNVGAAAAKMIFMNIGGQVKALIQ